MTSSREGSISEDNTELVDPFCLPNEPVKLLFEEIQSANDLITAGILKTPCLRSHLCESTGMEIYLKKDYLQYTGSFKERGARYALLMLPAEQKRLGVISASLGNHAQALSYHGLKLGIPVTVVMPVVAPIMKIQACRRHKANVLLEGHDMAESKMIAMRMAKADRLTYINGYDHPHVMAGQGTIALEILDDVPDLDAVIVPVGGGGLLAGVTVAVKKLAPKVQVIGVESERCPSFSNAMKAGKPVYTPLDATLSDGLAVPTVGYNAFATANGLIDKMVVVKEEWIALAILRLVEMEKGVVEGGGAAGIAAILAGHLPELKGKKVVVILSGGNIDTTVLGRCLERGLAVDGRLVKFSVRVPDRPTGLAELVNVISSLGVQIKDIAHERAWVVSDINSVEIRVVCETRDLEQSELLKRALTEHYDVVNFPDIPRLEAASAVGKVELKIPKSKSEAMTSSGGPGGRCMCSTMARTRH